MFSLKLIGLEKLQDKLNPKKTIGGPVDEQLKITTLKLEKEARNE